MTSMSSYEVRRRILRGEGLPAGLRVGESLDLSDCTGLTELPAGLRVGGSLDLSGCAGLRNVLRVPIHHDKGFDCYGVWVNGALHVSAGCRLLTIPDARGHIQGHHSGLEAEYAAALDRIEEWWQGQGGDRRDRSVGEV